MNNPDARGLETASPVARTIFGWGPSRLDASAVRDVDGPKVRFRVRWLGADYGEFDCPRDELWDLIRNDIPYAEGRHVLTVRSGELRYRHRGDPTTPDPESVWIEVNRRALEHLARSLHDVDE